MANELTAFEKKNMELLLRLADVSVAKKVLTEKENELKATLLPLMEEAGVVSIKNDVITISYIPETETVRLDTDAIKLADPGLYDDLMGKYNKRSKKRAYLRFSTK